MKEAAPNREVDVGSMSRSPRYAPVPVKGYESLYQVSDHGEVVSLRTGAVYAGHHSGKKYRMVVLADRGKRRQVYVHRLVATAFIGPGNGLCVNHKDGNKDNNAVENLEWVTVRQNNYHAILTGLKPASQKTLDMVRGATKTDDRNAGGSETQ